MWCVHKEPIQYVTVVVNCHLYYLCNYFYFYIILNSVHHFVFYYSTCMYYYYL